MKIILVTGGNRGIGLEICRQLDTQGCKVILGSRDFEKGIEAAKALSDNVIVKQLDVTDENSILKLTEFVKDEFGHLDVLVNNAGINKASSGNKKSILHSAKEVMEKNIPGARKITAKIIPALQDAGFIVKKGYVADVSLDEVKYITDTNLYGAWRMCQVFLPLLEKSENGRIINISSGMGEINSLAGDYSGYRMSKLSLNALTIMLAKELKNKGISVNAMCPGWVKTDMGGPNATREVSEGADTAVWLATEPKIPTGKFFRDRKEIDW
jgi:NAD(P)-dependent dehydrogenase (short-subunit alcohol dehydrogenase family)